MQMKKDLATALVGRFYSSTIAENELKQFEQVFSKNKLPDEMPVFKWEQLSTEAEADQLIQLMGKTELFESKGAIRRLIAQGGVKLNGEKQTDPQTEISKSDEEQVFQAGKRIFFKIGPKS